MKITKDVLLKAMEPTIEVVKEFRWQDRACYANWTAQTYYFVCHSTRLFCHAAAKTPLHRDDFHNRFLKHMAEEKGHEHLARTDIVNLGFRLDDFPELPSTSALYQTQYYWINEVSAYSFFGYLLGLEGLAATVGKDVRALVSKTNSANSIKFIKVHSEEDLQHIDEVFEWLAKMPPEEQENVYKNLVNTLSNYKGMLNEVSLASKAFKQVA